MNVGNHTELALSLSMKVSISPEYIGHVPIPSLIVHGAVTQSTIVTLEPIGNFLESC